MNYLVSPLQLLLIIPFVRVGEHLLGRAMNLRRTRDPGARTLQAVVVLWSAIVHAAIGWVALGPVLIFLLYRMFAPLLARAADRLQATRKPT